MKNKKKWIILHHTGGTNDDPTADTSKHNIDSIDNWHRQLGFKPSVMGHHCGYHYVLEWEGGVIQARQDWEAGFHCRGMNTRSIGICLTGNFDRPVGLPRCRPSVTQEQALEQLLNKLTKKYNIPLRRIVPHRKFASKTCYGKNLTDDWARETLKVWLEQRLKIYEEMLAVLIKMLSLLKVKEKYK